MYLLLFIYITAELEKYLDDYRVRDEQQSHKGARSIIIIIWTLAKCEWKNLAVAGLPPVEFNRHGQDIRGPPRTAWSATKVAAASGCEQISGISGIHHDDFSTVAVAYRTWRFPLDSHR